MKGLKITAILAGMTVLAVVSYFMFFKKDSKLFLFKGTDGDGGLGAKLKAKNDCKNNGGEWDDITNSCSIEETETGGGTGGGSGASTNSAITCTGTYPKTPFKSTSEGNNFRKWVNKDYPAVAQVIDLDKTGSYDNCWIRKAYDYKVAGGRTLGSLYSSDGGQDIVTVEVDALSGKTFEDFKNKLSKWGIPFYQWTASDGTLVVTTTMHSQQSNMDKYYYHVSWAENEDSSIDLGTNGTSFPNRIVDLHWKLSNGGSTGKVFIGKTKQGDSMIGKGWTSIQGNPLFPIRKAIQEYWSGYGMSQSDANTIKAISEI